MSIQLEVGGIPSAILALLRTVKGVKSAQVVNADGTTPAAGLSLSIAGVNTYKVEELPGVDTRPQMASALVGGGYQLIELKAVRPSLEDVFVSIISKETAEEETEEDEEWEEDEDNGDGAYQEQYDETEEAEPVVATPPTRDRVTARKRVRR